MTLAKQYQRGMISREDLIRHSIMNAEDMIDCMFNVDHEITKKQYDLEMRGLENAYCAVFYGFDR